MARVRAPVRARARGAAARGARRRDDDRRRLDARRRADVRRRRARRAPRRRLGLQRVGRPRGRPVLRRGITTISSRARSLEIERRRSLPRAAGARGRLDPRRRRGHVPHHRGVPAQPQPQPVAHARGQIEEHLRDYLGVERVLWLGAGTLQRRDRRPHRQHRLLRCGRASSRCTGPTTTADPQHEISRGRAARGSRRRPTRAGARSRCVELPMPGPMLDDRGGGRRRRPRGGHAAARAGDRLAGSYANFYIGDQPRRRPAARRAPRRRGARDPRGQFPGREVVGVPAREILLGGGNVHCITQQVPAPPAAQPSR